MLLLLSLLFSIVIESFLFPVLSICVLFDWSVSLSKKMVGTVGCTLWPALSKQIKIIFFVWKQHYSHPHRPPPHLSILKLWSNFILGLNFIFFCCKLIIIHYHTQKPTNRGRNQPRLLILETSPLSPTVNSPNNPTTGRRNKSSKQDPRVALCCSLVFIKKKIEKKKLKTLKRKLG